MGLVRNLLLRFGLADTTSERTPINVFLLDDDRRRHRWFESRFSGDVLDIAETVDDAKTLLAESNYDAIFLDHDLLPHHYETNDHDDYANTGYAIAEWLNERVELQRAAAACPAGTGATLVAAAVEGAIGGNSVAGADEISAAMGPG